MLQQIGRDERPVTHDTLDELPTSKVLVHLRSVLVATGTLPSRDERLVALEKWITTTVQARTDPAERRILHGSGGASARNTPPASKICTYAATSPRPTTSSPGLPAKG
ncbi:hypothetical protein ABZ826_38525 [Streptomyces sp. NPDC047515]|uniref:hypothetical protein n=1 Tax=Streptomyces sp. NPDC047515 TaxID=3155380 RepID=UPI0033D4679B